MSASKGGRREKQAADLYERAGYETFRPQRTKFGENDMFGMFDFLAIHPERGDVVLGQVKSNQPRGYKDWFNTLWNRFLEPLRTGLQVHYLICYDREGWRLFASVHAGDGYVQCYDERQDDTVGPNQHTERSIGDGLAAFLENGSQPEEHAP